MKLAAPLASVTPSEPAIVDQFAASLLTWIEYALPAPFWPNWTCRVMSSPHVMTVGAVSVIEAAGAAMLMAVDVAVASVVTGAVAIAVARSVYPVPCLLIEQPVNVATPATVVA